MSEPTDFSETTQLENNDQADTHPEMVLNGSMAGRRGVLNAALRCNVGAVRERNEDSCLMIVPESGGHFPLRPFGLFIAADGMGGHENGHEASKTASRTAASYLLEKLYLPLLHSGETLAPADIESVMQDAVLAAHTAVYHPDPARDGGTTLTVALVLGQQLYVAHVGDSRAYWLVDGKLEAITSDHSLVQRLRDVGRLTAEEASTFQYRNILLRALGQEDDLEVDVFRRELPAKGKLLLCTDGLCGLVDDALLRLILQQPLSPAQTAGQLVNAAMQAGGYDNISAVVVDFNY